MDSFFSDFFTQFKGLKVSDLLDIYKVSRLRTVKAGELIAKEGDIYSLGVGVIKGLVRTYVIKTDGEEKTIRLNPEKTFTGCANCMLNAEPSFEYLEAVENSILVEINVSQIRKLSEDNIRILKFWSGRIEEALEEAVHRIEFLVTLTPEERYLQLLKESPRLVNRVPQKYLASYIGVTTVSLSRIRSRVSKNNN